MSLPRPPSLDCIKDIKNRIDLLLRVGPITKDLLVSAEEASAITGWTPKTVKKHGQRGRISAVKYGHRSFYLATELCDEVIEKYEEKKAKTSGTSEPKPVRRGRPPKKRKGGMA